MLLHPLRALLLNKDKIAPIIQGALRQPPCIDGMGIHDNGAVIPLSENFRQAHLGHHAAAKDILQHRSRPHSRQLVRIPHQNYTAAHRHRLQKMAHQHDIHHGHLVQDNHIRFQRLILIAAEAGTLTVTA